MWVILDQIRHYWVLLAAIGGGFSWLCRMLAKRFKREEEKRAAAEAMRAAELEAIKAENAAQSEGLQAILRQNIIDNHTKYSEREYISIHGLEHCESMYKAYKALGGNSFVTGLMKDVRDLPKK